MKLFGLKRFNICASDATIKWAMESAHDSGLSCICRANTLPVVQCALQQHFPMGASGFCCWLMVDVID